MRWGYKSSGKGFSPSQSWPSLVMHHHPLRLPNDGCSQMSRLLLGCSYSLPRKMAYTTFLARRGRRRMGQQMLRWVRLAQAPSPRLFSKPLLSSPHRAPRLGARPQLRTSIYICAEGPPVLSALRCRGEVPGQVSRVYSMWGPSYPGLYLSGCIPQPHLPLQVSGGQEVALVLHFRG